MWYIGLNKAVLRHGDKTELDEIITRDLTIPTFVCGSNRRDERFAAVSVSSTYNACERWVVKNAYRNMLRNPL